MSNVIAINARGELIGDPFKADPKVVECIELLLQQAKDGLIRGLAYATEKAGAEDGSTAIAGTRSIALIGAVAILQARLMDDIRE